MKNILKSNMVQGIVFLMAISASSISFDSEANEISNPQSICEVMSNYGAQAAHEKINSPEMSESDSYDLLVYGLIKTDDFNKLESSEKDVFLDVISDVYKYVYSDDSVTEKNAINKVHEYCIGKTDLAWSKIISRTPFCQAKGRVYELAAKLRDSGQSKIFAKEYLTSGIDDANSMQVAKDAIESVYSNHETPSMNGKMVYDECLRN